MQRSTEKCSFMGGHTNNWKIQEMISILEWKAFAELQKESFLPTQRNYNALKEDSDPSCDCKSPWKTYLFLLQYKDHLQVNLTYFYKKKSIKTFFQHRARKTLWIYCMEDAAFHRDKSARVTNRKSLPQYYSLTNIVQLYHISIRQI